MAGHAASLGTLHRRVDHIQELTAGITAQMQLVSHLMTVVFKAGYDFLTVACLVAGVVFLADNRAESGTAWGGAGLALALIWIMSKGASRAARRIADALRAEPAETGAGKKTTEPAAAPADRPQAGTQGRPAATDPSRTPPAPASPPSPGDRSWR